MAIPEHVKRQAMDAVAHRETTAQIHAYKDSGVNVAEEYRFTHRHPETRAQIQLVKDTGQITPPVTPMRGQEKSADKVNDLFRVNPGMDVAQKTMTRDGFGRE